MNNYDQQLIDQLFNMICTQKIRYDHFKSTFHSNNNSVWNKYSDEKRILDFLIEKYKLFYKNKALELQKIIIETKDVNIKSYLTYDISYYIKLHENQLKQINEYISKIENLTLDIILKEKINSISTEIDLLFPSFIISPTLIGLL